MVVHEAKQTIYSPQHYGDQNFSNPIPSNGEQNRDAFEENYSTFFNHANYNKTQPIPTIHIHPYNQIRDIHGSNRNQTNNLHAQHLFDQAINNSTSSNSQLNRYTF